MHLRRDRPDPRSLAHVRTGSAQVLGAVLGAFVLLLVGCAPAAGSVGSFDAQAVELEVRVATDCELGVNVVVVSDGKSFAFADPELLPSEDPTLPYFATMVVPGRPDAPYRVGMVHVCGDDRQMSITTYRIDGDGRTTLATTTMTGRGQAGASGTM